MEAQAAAEIRNAIIAWNAAKHAARASANARDLQEQLLSAEVEKFRAGFSTNFAVIQQQAYLAQAETTEIAAQTAWQKAGVQLDRALGDTLQRHGVDIGNLRRNRAPVSLPKARSAIVVRMVADTLRAATRDVFQVQNIAPSHSTVIACFRI